MSTLFFEELDKYAEDFDFRFSFKGKNNNAVMIIKEGKVLKHLKNIDTSINVLANALNFVYNQKQIPPHKRVC